MVSIPPNTTSILLRNGTLLLHCEHDDRVTPLKADLLVVGNRIAQIGGGLAIPPPSASGIATTVIDCTGKIVAPGFVDTHHHVWQTQLKGRYADHLLLDYIPRGIFTGSLFTPKDIFWGELGGCLEAIDGGTTTVVDHAHMNYSAEHSSSAIAATVASGIRSFFCYCPTSRITSWSPLQMDPSLIPDWVLTQFAELAAKQPFGDGRVHLGLAFDAYFLPKDVVVALFENARKMGVKLITSHYVRNAIAGSTSTVALLESYGLLQRDVLLSHMNQPLPEDAAQLAAANAHIASTPSAELQLAMGTPVCFHPDMHAHASLGIDCHSIGAGDMLSQMRLALQSARGAHNQRFIDVGKLPTKLNYTAEDAFNLATIMGARAVGLGAEVGSITVGKLADLVVFEGETPGMVCAAAQDPLAAVVLHASVRDVDTVIVDGRIKKTGGKLVAMDVGAEGGNRRMEWTEVAKELLASRVELQKKIDEIDMDVAQEATIQMLYIDKSKIVDTL
ncbi:hypothetical protein C8J57DRAFT_1446955 [Mycena rebaudengoi]|nr:hypothetical protein C8J57DRAFT_1446955 [Mycena rebaudengoi]